MNTQTVIDVAVPVLSGMGGVAGAAFWFKRWVNQVDQRLDKLTAAVNTLARSSDVAKSELSQTQGQFKQSQICLDNSTAQLAKLSGNIDALWRVLESNKHVVIPSRLSDTNA